MSAANPVPTQARIGRAIRSRRRELGLSLSELAAKLGVANSTMSKLENGLVPITFERLDAISRLLQIDMVALVADEISIPTAADRTGTKTRSEEFGARRSITRGDGTVPVDAGFYTLFFHATDILEKRFQPATAEVHLTDIAEYGPLTRHPGEEFNYVLSGELEFHTAVYTPVRLTRGDSVYFDAEMGHAHIKLGDEPCVLLAIFVPRTAESVKSNSAPVLEIMRAHEMAGRVKQKASSGSARKSVKPAAKRRRKLKT